MTLIKEYNTCAVYAVGNNWCVVKWGAHHPEFGSHNYRECCEFAEALDAVPTA